MTKMSVFRGLLLAAVAACSSSSNDMLPVGGGGGDGGVRPDSPPADGKSSGRDATPSAIDAAIIQGRVCLITSDPRKLGLDPANDCAATGAGGLTVRLGGKETTTNADGTFSIDAPATLQGSIWSVTGSSIVSSYEVFADYQIPALTTSLYQSMLAANMVIPLPGQGSVIAQLVSNGHGASGLTGASAPTSEYDPFYDGATATGFTQTSTGSAGVMWITGIDVGTATVKAATLTSPSLPIVDGALTFVTITFP